MFLFVAINVLNILDVVSTRIGLHFGLNEQNKPAAWAFRKIGFWKCMVLKVVIVLAISYFLYINLPMTEINLAFLFSILLLAVVSNFLWTLAKGKKPVKV